MPWYKTCMKHSWEKGFDPPFWWLGFLINLLQPYKEIYKERNSGLENYNGTRVGFFDFENFGSNRNQKHNSSDTLNYNSWFSRNDFRASKLFYFCTSCKEKNVKSSNSPQTLHMHYMKKSFLHLLKEAIVRTHTFHRTVFWFARAFNRNIWVLVT